MQCPDKGMSATRHGSCPLRAECLHGVLQGCAELGGLGCVAGGRPGEPCSALTGRITPDVGDHGASAPAGDAADKTRNSKD